MLYLYDMTYMHYRRDKREMYSPLREIVVRKLERILV